jgi:hypothetical protein
MFNFPDAASPIVRLIYRQRFWMFTPSVMTFMTERGCRVALAAAGFTSTGIRTDVQRPSLRKLLQHANLAFFSRALSLFGIPNASLPIALPLPAVRLVVARP